MSIKYYRAAGFPAVALTTAEEERFLRYVVEEVAGEESQIAVIAASGGLWDARTGAVIDSMASFPKAFKWAASRDEAILIAIDFQSVVRNAPAYRALKACFPELKARGSMIILVAPAWNLPQELEHDVPIIEWPLPTREQLRSALHVVAEAAGVEVGEEEEERLLDAAAGLTLQEAENSFALAFAECGRIDSSIVEREKMRLVRASGYLEVWPAVEEELVGGLGRLKEYFQQEVLPARNDPQLRVRGILLVGVPGTGKSLAAKAAGGMLGWPVLRMDIGALKGSLVGQSESNMRAALKLADAIAPCVLWIDEIEKGVGGFASSAYTDSGVTLGMVGALLTWMQEHTSPVLVVATCNDYSKLPTELTRAGRFDERFFVDLPTRGERQEIALVHLRRLGCPTELAGEVASLTDGWTGAEIEQLVKSAARRARRSPNLDCIRRCAREIKPISRVRAEEIEKLRAWARDTLRLANSPEDGVSPLGRRLRRGDG